MTLQGGLQGEFKVDIKRDYRRDIREYFRELKVFRGTLEEVICDMGQEWFGVVSAEV